MRIIAIIITIMLIAIIPSSSSVSYAIHRPGCEPTDPCYNFSSSAMGSYPISNASFHFWNTGDSNDFHAVISSGIGMNGMNVCSYHFGKWSFFNAAVCSCIVATNISVCFSWNNLLSAGLTGDSIILSSGSSPFLNISFGPYYSYGTRVCSTGNVTTLPNEPSMDAVCKLDIVEDRNLSSFYISSVNGRGEYTAVAVPIHSEDFPSSSNLTLSFGGECSNLTVYSLKTNAVNPPHYAYSKTSERFDEVSRYDHLITTENNYTGSYIVSRSTNSILYVASNSSIMRYNYYTMESSSLYSAGNGNNSWASSYSSGSQAAFILAGLNSYSFVDVNESSFSVHSFLYHIALNSTGYLESYDGGFILPLENGTVMILNRNGEISTEKDLLTAVQKMADPYLLYSGENAQSYDIAYYLQGDSEVIHFSLNISDLVMENETFTNMTSLGGKIGVTQVYDSGNETWSVLSFSSQNAGIIFSVNGLLIIPYSISRITFSNGNSGDIWIGTNSHIIEVKGNTVMNTGIPYAEGSPFFVSSGFLFVQDSGYEALFNLSGMDPYSPFHISVSGNNSFLMTSTYNMSLNVKSELPYILTAQLQGLLYNSNSSVIVINTSSLENGKYSVNVSAVNTAGYTSEFNATAMIDNGLPVMKNSFQTTDYFHTGEEVNYSVEWKIGISSIVVNYLGKSYSLNTPNGSFVLNAGNYSGFMDISFLVTDNYGRQFFFNYSVIMVYEGNVRVNMSIYNGEYLNTTFLNLSWTELSSVRYYEVDLNHDGTLTNYSSSVNEIPLNLTDGKFSITVLAFLLDNSTFLIGEANITVITSPPALLISHSNDTFYSFFGDSANSSLYLNARSGNSSEITLHIFAPDGSILQSALGVNELNYTIQRNNSLFTANGIYTVNVTATGKSRLNTYYEFNFIVNNTIPENPFTNGEVIYTNSSFVSMAGLGSRYSLFLINGNGESQYYVDNFGIIMNTTGIFEFSLSVMSDSLNVNTSVFTVYFFNLSPSLIVDGYNKTLTSSPAVSLHLHIMDGSPLSSVTLRYGDRVMVLGTKYNQTVKIVFPYDGNYNVTIGVADKCGNFNSTSFSVMVEYYPFLSSYRESVLNFFAFQSLSVKLTGYNLSAFKEKWYVNGRPVGNGRSILYSSSFGMLNITVEISYSNLTYYSGREVFSTGPYVILAAVLAVSVYFLYPLFFYSNDDELAMKLLTDCSGLRVSEIRKQSRKKHIRFDAVKRKMDILTGKGKAKIFYDPDGNEYFKLTDDNGA